MKINPSARLDRRKLEFLSKNYIARVATSSKVCIPHVSPVYFASDPDSLFFATEKDTRKINDLKQNSFASAVVDEFDADWIHGRKGINTKVKAVVIAGRAKIFSRGKTYRSMYRKLLAKYPDYRADPWEESESPIVKIFADRVTSWGV